MSKTEEKNQTEEKRIAEALAFDGDKKSIDHLNFLINLYNYNIGMDNNNKYLALKLNSELWKEGKGEKKYHCEKISATLYFNQKPYFIASIEWTMEKEFTPKQRLEQLNSKCILILLAITKFGIDSERTTPLFLDYFRGSFKTFEEKKNKQIIN